MDYSLDSCYSVVIRSKFHLPEELLRAGDTLTSIAGTCILSTNPLSISF